MSKREWGLAVSLVMAALLLIGGTALAASDAVTLWVAGVLVAALGFVFFGAL